MFIHHVQLVYMGTGDAAANGAVMTLLLVVALTSLSLPLQSRERPLIWTLQLDSHITRCKSLSST